MEFPRFGRYCLAVALLSLGCGGDEAQSTSEPVADGGPAAPDTSGSDAGAVDEAQAPDIARPPAAVAAPDALGPLAIGHTMFVAVDAARGDRELRVDVWYPVDEADATDEPLSKYPLQGGISLPPKVAAHDLPVSLQGPCKLLVFSHGSRGINMQSTQLMETLASHGFIVAAPEHTGNTALDGSDPTPEDKRVPDVSFVIDTLLERSTSADDAFFERIDPSEVGVLGHSFGGTTALGMVAGFAGAEVDPRVSVIGVIAGGVGSNNFPAEGLATVTTPTILLVGTLDTPAVANHEYVFANLPQAEALFSVEVTGANHTHFANICAIGNLLIASGLEPEAWPALGAEALVQPYEETCTEDVFPIGEAHRLQNLYMVAHFKRYLLGQTGYESFLSSDYADVNEAAVVFEAKGP